MALRSKFKFARAKRLIPLAGALLMAALVAIPVSSLALAQTPPGDDIVLVNGDRKLVERKKDGRFVAHPLFNKEIDLLYYGVRHPRYRRASRRPVPGPGRRQEALRWP